uniref:ion channel n=1 Tax=Haloprofundus sp. MHR1 TaxID=2572921 RepID=UPI001F2D666D|nr:ion channel [Haloprofundus sp. MHR1]
MSLGYLLLGVLLLVIATVDILWTTLWIEGGAGPLTSRLMDGTWRTLRRLTNGNSYLLSLAGPFILVNSLAVWIALLWTGWTFVFAGSATSLINTTTGSSVSWLDQLYFTGYAMFTLGNGGFAPNGGIWQIVTVLVTANGMLFVTLSVTYVLSVLGAVTQKRSFAIGVTGLGTRGGEVIRAAWNGQEFEELPLLLNTHITELNRLTSNHKAYPILHYFHSARSDAAAITSIAVLDDALTILHVGIPNQHQPSNIILESGRSSIESYLKTLHGSFVDPEGRTPPPLSLDSVRNAGIPTVSESEFETALDDLKMRRRTLLELVESDERQWPTDSPS